MFDDELMKKPQQNLWGFFMWIIILGSLVFMLFSSDWRNLFEKTTNISVYLNKKQCQTVIEVTSQHMCGKNEQLADIRAKTIIWSYENKAQCSADFNSCKINPSGYWSPYNLGFAMVKLDRSYNAFPVYYSMKHKQYILASGYPVSVGENALPYFTPEQEYLVMRAGNLQENICFDMSDGERTCSSRNEMLNNPTKENLSMLMFSALSTKEKSPL